MKTLEMIYEQLGDGYGFNGSKEEAIAKLQILVGDLTRAAYARGYSDKVKNEGMNYVEWENTHLK